MMRSSLLVIALCLSALQHASSFVLQGRSINTCSTKVHAAPARVALRCSLEDGDRAAGNNWLPSGLVPVVAKHTKSCVAVLTAAALLFGPGDVSAASDKRTIGEIPASGFIFKDTLNVEAFTDPKASHTISCTIYTTKLHISII
eukprot:10618-Heterococcus_DN1.PRE.2